MGSRVLRLAALTVAALVAAACGGGGSAAPLPVPGAARTFALAGFAPAGAIRAGRPVAVSFAIRQPDGKPLTDYAQGSGPHTGVHLLFVRDDLSAIIHHHPPVAADGTIADTVTFPAPGRYRIVVDAYPAAPGMQKNFQLFRWITVAGKAKEAPLPAYAASDKVDGYTVAIHGGRTSRRSAPR